MLQIKDLEIEFKGKSLLHLPALSLAKGEVKGIIGESGSGKSLTLLAIMGLLPKGLLCRGNIDFNHQGDVIHLQGQTAQQMQHIRGKEIGMVFQEPMSSLNPRMRCGDQLLESLMVHQSGSGENARKTCEEALLSVGLTDVQRIYDSYPHQISGGQRQRVMIAMATINKPVLVLADEPTTALDPETGILVLEILVQRCRELGSALMLVSHDLEMVAKYADSIMVMRSGKVVTAGSATDVLSNNQVPYVKELLDAQHFKKPVPADQEVVLNIQDLSKTFFAASGNRKLFDGFNLSLRKGETIAVVGKSGSGKSTIAKILTRLEDADAGTAMVRGKDVLKEKNSGIQMVFQDPYSSLNNEIGVQETVAEVLRLKGKTRKDADEMAIAYLSNVGLGADFLQKYPHQLSGGQRQRLCIARALASEPDILILDESVAALDPLVKKQVLELLVEIQKEKRISYLFITHDMQVAAQFAHKSIGL
ncbi:MAG: ABC transporter ATP-binding protein [Bacteroidia bacterium]|nr:ABC transporter ATP-binding protein [Bacteroidia bacterium]